MLSVGMGFAETTPRSQTAHGPVALFLCFGGMGVVGGGSVLVQTLHSMNILRPRILRRPPLHLRRISPESCVEKGSLFFFPLEKP